MNKEKIIIALDVERAETAREIVAELGDQVGAFKIGLQLFTAAGASFVRELVDGGVKIFLDVKFHDIPNTVMRAAIEVARLGVWMFNVHAAGGSEMLHRTVEGVREFCHQKKISAPKIIGVTVLTSQDQQGLSEIGIENKIDTQVLNLAALTAKCGLDGIVASPHEVRSVRTAISREDFLIVTPGIRPAFATKDDQRRVMTPGEAVVAGSDFLVIGRPVIGAGDRRQAVRDIIREVDSVFI